jgi:hypothetical protein
LLLAGVGCAKKSAHAHEAEAGAKTHQPKGAAQEGPHEAEAKTEDAKQHEHAAGEAYAGTEIRIPLEGIRGLRLMKVPEARLEGRWLPGEAMGDEASQALLSSPVKGIVSQVLAIPGQNRAKGATLILIQSPELARLKAGWIAAKARLDRTQAVATSKPPKAKPPPRKPRRNPPGWAWRPWA